MATNCSILNNVYGGYFKDILKVVLKYESVLIHD